MPGYALIGKINEGQQILFNTKQKIFKKSLGKSTYPYQLNHDLTKYLGQ